MSATPRTCPRCGALLLTTPGDSSGQCSRCGAHFRLVKRQRRHGDEVAARPAPPLSAAPGTACATLPPLIQGARPRRLHVRPAAAAAAAFAACALIGGIGLAFVLNAREPESTQPQKAAVALTVEPTTSTTGSKPLPPVEKRPPPLWTPGKAERAIYQASASVAADSAVGRIDELVFEKLKDKDITPAAPCSDGVFVRRVYLDVIGTLPTAAEAEAFLKDTAPNKRKVLIDRLLERSEFADYWGMKWADILRVKAEFPVNLWPNAARAYDRWIRASIREEMPYDQFARTLLTSSGSNFRDPPVNFYRALQKKDAPTTARAVALTFMGVRLGDKPPEGWAGLDTFFAQVGYKATGEWKEEVVYFDPRKPMKPGTAVFPDGSPATIAADQDPRAVFADWLITAENPWFSRNIANRIWFWLLGRGIIHEPDDIRPDNPPSHPELLAFLEKELVAARYDLKHLYRLILNSKTYQLSCVPASEHPDAAALFAFYPIRRLDAEVLLDAICQITGAGERYSSPIPEPFTYLPEGQRAICLPDASISSAFLEMFGRPPRDSGLQSERNNNFTAAQRLHLLNSSHIQKKIDKGPGLAGLLAPNKEPKELADGLYLTILSRYPTREEREVVADLAQAGPGRRAAVLDVAWALLNSAEFLCHH